MSQNIFRNPYVLVSPALTMSSVGNGTLTIDRLTHFTINQQYTAICTAISPFTVFNIVGNLDGVVGVAIVGTQFTDEDNKIFVTIQQGPTLFQVGDTFEFTVAQGTDVNQQNIDLYDELPQKNFGLGQTGQNKGDHNLRFSLNPAAAFRGIGDILYTAVNTGPGGNAISIQYFAGTLLNPASLALQDLTFTANTAGAVGNLISMEYEAGNPGVNATVTIQDIAYEADNVGIAGNLISIAYTGGATAGSEVVSVLGNAITVQIEDGVSTADDIELAIALFPAAAALVNSTGTGTGSEIQFIQAATFLTGGVNADGMVVTVVGNAIKVLVQSGVTTAQEIKDALDGSVPALTLINTTITGSGASTQTSPVSPTFLSGGSDDVGTPGNEVVQVVGNEIRVSFVNGLSTATQILSKILATPAAIALVSASLIGPGSNFQSSPVSRTFLGGGRDGGSYAFNTEELTNPGQFFEGNAPIIHTGQTNQGDELTLGETLKKGKVTLDDDVVANNPGPLVDNAQRTINNLIQNHKVFLVTEDNSKVDWQEPNLNFTSNIAFIFPETGVINRILTAGSPIVIADGQHAYVTVNRLVTSTVTVTVASTIPTGENIFRLFSRRGDDLVWYDNTLQRENKKIRIGEGGGGGTAYQELIGTGNGVATTFPLTFIPSNEFSILVICSYVRDIAEYTYIPVGNQIQFSVAPAAGQDVYVFYLTEGETLTVPTPNGLLNSYVHTVTLLEETAQEITLLNTPAEPSKVLVDIIGGGPQEYNVDYNVAINAFQWAGYGLDGVLLAGDKVRFYFYS